MKTVFFDIDTQLDFLYPAGALYVPGAERIVPAIAHLNRFAAAHGIPVISTADAHAENDPEFAPWPPHCVAGTWGQRKAGDHPAGEARGDPQPRVRPGDLDRRAADRGREADRGCLPRAAIWARVIERLQCDRCVVYGVVTEICVLWAVRGLLKAGRQVVVVTDAVETLKAEDSARALEEMCAGGARLARVSEICAGN